MRRQRNTKIIATLGPSSSGPEVIAALFKAGADVFRLNFSHGIHQEHRKRFQRIRRIEKEIGRPIGILLDLQGPKLRLGTFALGPVQLACGDAFRLDLDPQPGDASRVPLLHPEIFAALKPGKNLLLDDGRVCLEVQRCGADFADTRVINGGQLSDRKGVNVPDVVVPLSALTAKDKHDLAFGLKLGVDWIALSFVQRPEDVDELREQVGTRAAILSKLEKPAAIERLDEIIERSDAIMVARGDLGVELPPEQVPSFQKRIVYNCRKAGKPVVVATHMLDSMAYAPVPTRAEASDVATAVYDGADAVMLSAETAAGEYPVESVAMMDRIIKRVEQDPYYRKVTEAAHPEPEATSADAVCYALSRVSNILGAAVIVTYTTSGFTSLRAARERPDAPILSLTPELATARRLALVWGVQAVRVAKHHRVTRIAHVVDDACRIALREGFAQPGQALVIAAGMPFGAASTTNILRIAWIDPDQSES